MKRNNNMQRKIGSLLSYVQMGIGVVIGLLYTPVMIRYLGQSEYGLYNTVAATISMLSILNLGFNSSYIKYYTGYKKVNDNEKIYKLNGLYMIVFVIIGIIAFFCGLYLSNNLNIIFKTGLNSGEYQIARTLVILLTINLSLSFPMGVFANIISAHESFIFLKLLGILKIVAGPLVTLPLLIIGYRSIAMVTVTLCVSLFVDVIHIIYSFAYLKIKFNFHNIDVTLFKSMFAFTFFIALNMIIDQINWNIDKLLLARYKGTVSVAVYSVGYTLYNYYIMFSTSISGVFTPRIHSIVNATSKNQLEQRKQLTQLFIKIGRIQFLILGLICLGLVFFGKVFIRCWVGVGYEDSYYVMLLLVIPSFVPLIQNAGIEIQRAENKHKFRSIVYLFMAIANLIMSIYLCQKYGPIGSAVGTAISLLIANGIIINIYYHKKCNIDIIKFWKSIGTMCGGLIIPIVSGFLISFYITFNHVWQMIITIIIYSIVYCGSVWFFSMNQEERNLIRKPLCKLSRGNGND